MNQSEKSLLQQYIRTLQKQNQSRHKQNIALTQTIDRLIAQNQQLRSKKSSNIAARVVLDPNQQQKIKKLQYELNQTKTAYQILIEQQNKNPELYKLRQEIKRKQEQNLILIQYKEKLQKQLREMQQLKSSSNTSSLQIKKDQSKQIIQYQTKIAEYQIKISFLRQQLAFQNEQYKTLNTKHTNQINSFNNKIQELQNKQRISQINTSSSEKLVLQSKIKQITIQYEDIKNQKLIIQREKQHLQIKISDLSTQIAQKNNVISQLKIKEQYSRNNQSVVGIKQKEIQNLNTLVRNLRSELEQSQYTLTQKQSVITQKQSIIRTLQIKASSNNSANDISTMKRLIEDKNQQINRLIQNHNRMVQNLNFQVQKYKSISQENSYTTKQFSVLKQENQFLRRQNQNNLQFITQLKNEKETLKQANQHYIRRLNQLQENTKINASNVIKYQVNQNSRIINSEEAQLRSIVLDLKKQLDDVRFNNSKIHQENLNMQKYMLQMSQINSNRSPNFGQVSRLYSPQNINKLYSNNASNLHLNFQEEQIQKNHSKHFQHQPYFKSQYNLAMKKKEQRTNQRHVSPVRDSKNVNKQKWENLQRKISALRVQNDELKRTLLYD